MDDDEVGYRKPPRKNQFKPGQSGNPAGSSRKRRKAKEPRGPAASEAAAALREIATELIDVGGTKMTRTGGLLRILFRKATEGDMRAMRLYFQVCEKTGLLERMPDPDKRTGVLEVPMAIDFESWQYLAAKHQAKYRTSEPWNPDEFVLRTDGPPDLG